MCQPDLTPRSVIWRENGLSAAANNTLEHTCVDWDSVQDWIDEHTISGSQPLIRSPNGTSDDHLYVSDEISANGYKVIYLTVHGLLRLDVLVFSSRLAKRITKALDIEGYCIFLEKLQEIRNFHFSLYIR